MTEESTRPLKVFLCHASGDKPAVRELYRRLLRDGVDAWLDKEKLLPGQDWQLEIPKAVRESDVVVICLSTKSITKEGYVQKEIKFALDFATEKPEGTIFLIPARLEECSVPVQLGSWQWVDLFETDGYERLMRSLRLRADKLGLRVGDTIYTDREVEQRLDQLYTEGLAALWVEDWDKAYRRFQAILREKPDHIQAIAKLDEAKRQKYLSDLYMQALDAQKSENWPTAVKILEKLMSETTDYRDVSSLLKNAQKKNQLARLYEEARRLYQAKQWQAVIRVFAQIAAIEPGYEDPDGLLPVAEKEAAELKRLAALNDLYSRGVREMDAGNWYEARGLLEQVHKAQTGFLETERLLRKIENEITKIEELQKRNIQINTLYEQAHGLLRSKNWREVLGKIEEIQQLDPRFEDKDEITKSARAALDLEEQEIQKQNRLAAMYAEAVRLLREGKYQEAFDKWQEVKAIDPKYPDRQSVQRTASKKLEARRPRIINGRQVGTITLLAITFVVVIWLSSQALKTPTVSSTQTKASASAIEESPMPAASPTPFVKYFWDFINNSQGWGDDFYTNVSLPRSIDGSLKFNITGKDPYIHSPRNLQIIANETPVITVQMRYVDGRGSTGSIYFVTNKDSNWNEAKKKTFSFKKDNGAFQTIDIDMSQVPTWRDVITQFRIDPVDDPTLLGMEFAIDYISVHAP